MALQGKVGEWTFNEKPQVYSSNHPVIILTHQLPNLGTLSAGTVLGRDQNGAFVVYDPNATDANNNPLHEPYGVIVEDVDTATNSHARVLVLGVVYEDAINVNGQAPTSADKEALRALNIYVINRS